MATQSVPVPAVVAEHLAKSALEEVEALEDRGYSHSSDALQKSAGLVLQRAAHADAGEFVSISGHVLSDVTAHRAYDADKEYVKCARHFLQQYNVWGEKE